MSKHTSGDNLTAVADYLSASLLGMVFFPVLLFILELYAKINGEIKWQLSIAAALAVPVVCFKCIEDRSAFIKIIAVLLLVIGIEKALVIASLFYDMSWDSMSYHADAIMLLLKDNNPMYQAMHGFDDSWTNSYPKATWYFASLIIHATGNYNLGKAYNLFLLYAAASYVFSFLKRRQFSTGNALLVAVAVAASPVAISQMQTFYVDGALCSLMTLAVFSSIAMFARPQRIDKFVFILSACLLINIKFTGLAYILVIYAICALVMLWRWYKSKAREDFEQGKNLAYHMILVLLAGVIIMGSNPYITNTLAHGNPFFPLAGKGKVDVVAAQSPKSFNEHNTPTAIKLLISAFSKSVNVVWKKGTAEPEIKLPFSTSEEEMSVFAYNDVRIGGWGVLFGGLLTTSAALYLLSHSWKNTEMNIAILFVLATALINPGSWWARYAPQVALLPVLLAIPSFTSSTPWQRILARFVFVIFLLNSFLIFIPSTEYVYQTSEDLQHQIDTAVNACGKGVYEILDTEGYHYEQFLERNGITVVYPEKEDKGAHPKNGIFRIGSVFIYKKGCASHL